MSGSASSQPALPTTPGLNVALLSEGGHLIFTYSCDLGAILISSMRVINWASLERD